MAPALLFDLFVLKRIWRGQSMETPQEPNRYQQETGAIGYMILWAMGVPASLLFLVFLLRGCN